MTDEPFDGMSDEDMSRGEKLAAYSAWAFVGAVGVLALLLTALF